MLKDFAKTSPVTFFALPIIIIGLLVLSYFLYSTFINQQIDARSAYLNRQLTISIEKINSQIDEFNHEVPFLAEIDDFSEVFEASNPNSGKLRYRIKHLAKRYKEFIDTIFIYDSSRVYRLMIDDKGGVHEGLYSLASIAYPLQFSAKPKMIHIEGNKSLAIIPTNVMGEGRPVYIAALVDVFDLIEKASREQFIGDYGCKIIFSENIGFEVAQLGNDVSYEFGLADKHRKIVVNDLLRHKSGKLIHAINRQGYAFLTVYQPFELFSERYGLIFSVSDRDFIEPIRNKLQIIFLSFFVIIAIVIVVFIINLRDISRNTEELEESREGLARALVVLEAQQENYRDGLLIADENLMVVSFNRKLLDLFNFPEKPVKGMSVSKLMKKLSDACKNCPGIKKIEALANQKTEEELSEEIEMNDGRTYDFYSSSIKDEFGYVYGRLWTFRDISHRKREIEELKKARQQALEGAREKENFLSTMSHEIRTPLNSIVGFANLLLEENPRHDQIEQLQPLKYSADALLNLINDILDLTKIESGRLQLEQLEFNLNTKLDNAKKIFEQQAVNKGLSFDLLLDVKISDRLVGDYNRLNQIVFNLLSNAIKFTSIGGVFLGSKLIEERSEKQLIEIFVKDTGIGIEGEKLKMIFESFSQADSNTTRKFGGTGLGLAIVKKLTEMQGGKVGVESVPGKGSKFWVNIEYQVAQLPKKELKKQQEKNLKNKLVLLVEDNPFNQKVAEKFLSKWGASTITVSSGEKAMEVIQNEKFDAVLMDLQMPGMDGYETALAIRALDGKESGIKIYAMSADALGDVEQKVKAAKMDGYISKPFNPNELLELLTNS